MIWTEAAVETEVEGGEGGGEVDAGAGEVEGGDGV
jgi:hypothetical protein